MSHHKGFYYSDKYSDDHFEYRHVHIPKEKVGSVPKDRLMSEEEWRALGVQQSVGWEHYMKHKPDQNVLLFRRSKCMR